MIDIFPSISKLQVCTANLILHFRIQTKPKIVFFIHFDLGGAVATYLWLLSVQRFIVFQSGKYCTFSHHSREVLILKLPILPALQGCISWYIPRYWLMMREWTNTASSWDILGCTSPPTSRFPVALEMSLGLWPREISWSSGMYNPIPPSSRQCTDNIHDIGCDIVHNLCKIAHDN